MTRNIDERGSLATVLTWLGAGALALALHIGVIALLVGYPEPASTATVAEPTVEIDLEPVEGEKAPDDMPPAESSGDPAEAAVAAADSAAAAAALAPPPMPVAPRPPDPPPPPVPVPPTSEPPTPEPAPPPPSQDPPPLPPPESTPAPPPPPPEPPKVEAVPPTPVIHPSRASAASTASAASEETAPAVQRLSASRVSAWRGRLVAHLNRFRRFPPGIGSGTARIGFTIDGAGRVTAVSVVSGSGSMALDAAARELVARASPFPAPPAGLSEKSLSFVVPVHFDGHRQ